MKQLSNINELLYAKLTSHIAVGEENAIKMNQLLEAMNLKEKDKRDVQSMIERARGDDVLILSSGKGYFFPSNIAELRRYINSQKRRIKSHWKALKPFIKELNRLEELEKIQKGETLL